MAILSTHNLAQLSDLSKWLKLDLTSISQVNNTNASRSSEYFMNNDPSMVRVENRAHEKTSLKLLEKFHLKMFRSSCRWWLTTGILPPICVIIRVSSAFSMPLAAIDCARLSRGLLSLIFHPRKNIGLPTRGSTAAVRDII